MDLYELTEEQKALRTMIRDFAEKEVKPRVSALDQTHGEVDWDLIRKACQLGLFTGFLPKKYGGGMGGISGAIISEELAAVDAGFSVLVGAWGLGIAPVAVARDKNMMDKVFPPMIEAEKTGKPIFWAYAITEPDAGSDVEDDKGCRTARLGTIARREGDHYVINGRKCFITGGNIAKWVTVFAALDKKAGIDSWTCFLVPSDAKGFSVGKIEDKMGQRAAPAVELIFDDVKVPIENRVGQEGEGWKINRMCLSISRPTVGAIAIGTARGAYEKALNYAAERYQGGRKIIEHQMIQLMLADAATAIEAARLMIYHATLLRPTSDKFSSMAKIFATDAATRITSDAIQIMGGYGYMRDYGVEKHYRDVKICQIFEGTNQINRLAIMQEIMREISYQPQ